MKAKMDSVFSSVENKTPRFAVARARFFEKQKNAAQKRSHERLPAGASANQQAKNRQDQQETEVQAGEQSQIQPGIFPVMGRELPKGDQRRQ